VSATHMVPACTSPRALSLSSSILAQDVSEPSLTLETFRRLKAVRGKLGAEGTAVLSREGRVSEKLYPNLRPCARGEQRYRPIASEPGAGQNRDVLSGTKG
jgi:hypothetical protein